MARQPHLIMMTAVLPRLSTVVGRAKRPGTALLLGAVDRNAAGDEDAPDTPAAKSRMMKGRKEEEATVMPGLPVEGQQHGRQQHLQWRVNAGCRKWRCPSIAGLSALQPTLSDDI